MLVAVYLSAGVVLTTNQPTDATYLYGFLLNASLCLTLPLPPILCEPDRVSYCT
jgi:hypothetical protein